MIIDFHTHTFPDKIAAATVDKLKHFSHSQAFSDGSVSGLLETQTAAGVDLSVILPVATSARQVEKINESAYELNSKYNGKGLFSFSAMHPDFENYAEELTRMASLGMKGVKLHSTYQHVDVDDIRNLRICYKAAELGLIVVIHAGIDIGFPDDTCCAVPKIRHAIDEIGDFRLVAAHMGGWKNWGQVLQLLAGTSCYLDTAFSTGQIHPLEGENYYSAEDRQLMTPDEFLTFLDVFGPERIMFGTDSPWSSTSEGMQFIRDLPISEEDKKAVLGQTAEKLLGL